MVGEVTLESRNCEGGVQAANRREAKSPMFYRRG